MKYTEGLKDVCILVIVILHSCIVCPLLWLADRLYRGEEI